MSREIEVVKLSFSGERGLTMFLHRVYHGCYEMKTFYSRELLAEMKKDENIKKMIHADIDILLAQGFEEMKRAGFEKCGLGWEGGKPPEDWKKD